MASVIEGVVEAVAGLNDEMIDTRRVLHANPELSFEEVATTALIRERLRGLGLQEQGCPTDTGAVFTLDGGRPGPTILLRADIDALPVQEEVDVPFASRVEGQMHACGHDAHAAILLGVAAGLVGRAEDLAGRYLFVFQPAEEKVSGAQAMVDGGVLDGDLGNREAGVGGAGPVAALGCHVTSVAPLGTVGSRTGLVMAGVRGLEVTVTGAGGHGAMQPRIGNVVLGVSRFADRLERVVAGMASEGAACVCSPGLIRAGTAPNVVPTRAVLNGTLRFYDDEQLTEARRRLTALAEEVAGEFEVQVTVEETYGTGPVRNDAAVTRAVLGAGREAVPDVQFFEMERPTAPSDDMSVFLDRVPGCYLMVGAAGPGGPGGGHHSPTFSIDEGCLRVGASVLAAAAVALGAGGRPG